ncbi:hypothetical protein AKJ56_02325 [candidate division MSBL1 archaeon SCGC-AAA382N08]|uniref:Uncharacterized protein n=1 Tax=candidate division MSBL1 archaeon SCGC-AAA382N08 TaxID=1698285 RepID=A0A133VMW4_9EURY|nr:hypothetical protein AKJ56_02325 [candidate division MSBL1 archaeon SCGC-AAA382N08]
MIIKAWRNYLVFNPTYFSMPALARTLFSYWRQYHYSYGRGFDPQRYFEAFTFNMISRVLGALIRLFLLFLGAVVEVFIVVGGFLILLIWLILPLLLIAGLVAGFNLVI